MRYLIRKSIIEVIGEIWLPYGALCAQSYTLSDYDMRNVRDYGDGTITRDAVEHWLAFNSGDFSRVVDFRADLEDGDQTVVFEWAHGEESECTYSDCMYPAED